MTVLLLSGGLDSAVCLAAHRPDVALFVNYGQPHRDEEGARAFELCRRFGIALRHATIRLPWWRVNPEDPTMYVPGRNLILVSLAAALDTPVMIGCNADDYENYPDCRPEFFRALTPVIEIQTPLIHDSKPAIGALARDLELAAGDTWSCYYPVGYEQPCDECDACKGRARALA